ncbi:hypothetical protein CHU92_12495 [Flavobacterium cyanobacteriorum]|uniref:Uncharacterized protein n=1 Tax=Flavobacterium cyanobacteriorum TaxID=2022802 RepID=A0A255YXK6_9FLAO|nr:hypothetical protein [Flavobacterium cyanobacteriorum]OYQ33901.1 hypothetical protein CHU92_12495 [Flavobacterium cyanobacteriorum]
MKLNIYKLLLFLVCLGVAYLFLKGYLYKREIKNNKQQTVCKFVYCEKAPKTTRSFFKYNIYNRWYTNSYGQCPEDYEKKINNFYTLYYSSKDPHKIEVDFNIPVTDTVIILKSGFTKEDLKN